MILIDLGNTQAKIFTNSLEHTIKSDELLAYLSTIKDQVLLCSVVPRLTKLIAKTYPNVKIITPDDYRYIFDNSDMLTTKGADRILATYGSMKKYGLKVVVVDIGTCVTVDVVNDRQYERGLIYPGFNMLEEILNQKVEHLPRPEKSDDMVGTASQIYWANLYGFIGALQNLLRMMVNDEEYQVVMTGGSIRQLKEEYEVDILAELKQFKPIYDPNLIRFGLEQFSDIINIEEEGKKRDV